MKPIIFLEIDGVLTSQRGTDNAMRRMGDIFHENGIERFCPNAVESLNRITNSTESDIVLTSDWRLSMTLDELRELFKERGITGTILDIISKDESNPAYGIKLWMKENGQPKQYVIIDDENEIESMCELFPDNRCVGTQFTQGLAAKSIYKRSINYLNRSEEPSKIKENKHLF